MAKRNVEKPEEGTDDAEVGGAPRGPMRAMWKASLDVGGITVPVKLYAAVEDRDVRFRLLDTKNRVPVKQRIVDPRSGEPVDPETVLRGVEVESGTFVVMTAEDVARDEPEPSRTIELTRFVPRAAIDFAWFDRPYLLGPDDSPQRFLALLEALRASGRFGIARWTMRGKRYAGSLGAGKRHLSLVTLRSAEEVVTSAELPPASGKPVSSAERELAKQFLSTLDGTFEPEALRNEYRERLLEYLAAKASGKRVKLPKEKTPVASDDLTRALKKSLELARKRRAA